MDNNDCHPHNSKLATQTFQLALIQGLPTGVQKGLKTVVALNCKPWQVWVDHLDHHLRLKERRLEKEDDFEELKKQLLRMQEKEQEEKSKQNKSVCLGPPMHVPSGLGSSRINNLISPGNPTSTISLFILFKKKKKNL